MSTQLARRCRSNLLLLGTLLLAMAWSGSGVGVAQELSDAAKLEFFDSQIFGILKERCFSCHGGKRALKGSFRVTSRAGLLRGGDSGPALNLEQPDQSHLLSMIRAADSDQRMPPDGRLTDAQIALIVRWVKMGAPYNPQREVHGEPNEGLPTNQINERTRTYWAFQPIQRPPLPRWRSGPLPAQPIDSFVDAQLHQRGLAANGPATRQQWLRRASYDLLGLPPTPIEVRSFDEDRSPDATSRVVDRLLAAPQYGEKWGRHWLDLVRYAETNGYERDSNKDLMWKFRDYVIRSLNEDKPYDRFVLEQLAGDELTDADPDAVIATGFYRLGIWDDEPADRELARYDYLDDILRTTGETMLGMTLGCARCHDHKIDPIPQADYYSMLAFFADISPHGAGKRNHVPITDLEAKADYERRLAVRQTQEMELQRSIETWEREFVEKLAAAKPELKLDDKERQKPRKQDLLPVARGESGTDWKFTLTAPAKNWFELAFDDGAWKQGPAGFGTKGTPGSRVHTEWKSKEIWLRRDFRLTEIPGRVILHIHHDEDAEVYLNGKPIKRFVGFVTDYKQVDVTVECFDLLQTGRNTLAIHCRQTGGGQYIDAGLVADDGRVPTPVLAAKYGREILGAKRLQSYQDRVRKLAELKKQKLERKTEFAMAVSETGRHKTWVLNRGNPRLKGAEVGPALPQILDPPKVEVPGVDPKAPTTFKRRALAEWIVSKQNRLTSRVMVNRLWQHHFGRGIVRSANNFGFLGELPTHPHLLNWLAAEFMRGEWQLKRIHRLLMTSRLYQTSSRANLDALRVDPTNDLFWRFNMRRLTAEEIRDSILNLTGQINFRMGGASIYSEVPRDVLRTASRPGAAWGNSSPAERSRRSVYIFVKRSLREPFLESFDWADTDNTCDVRFVTTVPTQTLTMLNSKLLNDASGQLASRLSVERPDDPTAQVRRALELATSRAPLQREVDEGLALLSELREQLKLEPAQALQRFCLLVLNLNEFVYLD